jgi:hypothetical protein
LLGFKCRNEEWPRPLELPAASGIMVRSLRATTECEFDLAANTQIAEISSNPGSQAKRKNSDAPRPRRLLFVPNRASLMACSIASRPSRCAAALRAGP